MRGKIFAAMAALTISLGFAGCKDEGMVDGSGGTTNVAADSTAVLFSGSVVTSQPETRADGSIVNRLETYFQPPGTTYYQYNPSTGGVDTKTTNYQVGIFGALTGEHTWRELELARINNKAVGDRTSAETTTLDNATSEEQTAIASITADDVEKYYSANFFFNQPATIGTPVDPEEVFETATASNPKRNRLTYEPLKFWSNNKIDGSDTKYHRATFWGYYPWNATVTSGAPGDHGIHVNTGSMGVAEGSGMGSVQFTMHPDASEHSDFMISDVAADCSKDTYALLTEYVDGKAQYTPKPVPLRFHHALAQVRLYAFIMGADRMVYKPKTDGSNNPLTDSDGNTIIQKADADWFDNIWKTYTEAYGDLSLCSITDALGNMYIKTGADEVKAMVYGKTDPNVAGDVRETLTKDEFVALNLSVPDEDNCERWYRDGGIRSVEDSRYRALIDYEMAFNNIHTQCVFTPEVTYNSATQKYSTKLTSKTLGTLGSATVNHYVMNPYWFRFDKKGNRVMLNDTYMYDYFEDTPGYKATTMTEEEKEQDGKDWLEFGGKNALGYTYSTNLDNNTALEVYDERVEKHYNYAPGNIILAVPQVMNDDDVPNITITATGYKADAYGNKIESKPLTAKVTINLLQMQIKWESGFIYCYAFVDELAPGDDKVRGPETITVVFDQAKHTDQW